MKSFLESLVVYLTSKKIRNADNANTYRQHMMISDSSNSTAFVDV